MSIHFQIYSGLLKMATGSLVHGSARWSVLIGSVGVMWSWMSRSGPLIGDTALGSSGTAPWWPMSTLLCSIEPDSGGHNILLLYGPCCLKVVSAGSWMHSLVSKCLRMLETFPGFSFWYFLPPSLVFWLGIPPSFLFFNCWFHSYYTMSFVFKQQDSGYRALVLVLVLFIGLNWETSWYQLIESCIKISRQSL